MEKELKKIFQKAKYEPNPILVNAVCSSIVTRDRRKTKLKLWIFALVALSSLTALVPTARILVNDLTQSGFYKYFSLLLGGGVIFSYWKELAFSLAESLPTMSIILTLSLVFIFIFSLRHFMKQFGGSDRIARHQLSF